MSRIWVLVVMVMSVGMVGQAWGTDTCDDLPAWHPYDELDCDVRGGSDVCTSCTYDGDDYVCCYGSNGNAADLIVLVELAGSPYAYGTLDVDGGGEVDFCCDYEELGTTSAIDVRIFPDYGDDIVCLQEFDNGSCIDEVEGLQVWGAAAYVEDVGGLDEIYTCPSCTEADYIDAGNDRDIIYTYGGEDTVLGGGGDDTIRVGDGSDFVDAGAGADIVGGGDGSDTLEGGDNSDTIHGDAGIDIIRGGDHGDSLFGGTEGDEMVGDAGVDYVAGGDGDDCVCGGSYGTSGENSDSSADVIKGEGTGDWDYCYWWSAEGDVKYGCEDGEESEDCPCAAP